MIAWAAILSFLCLSFLGVILLLSYCPKGGRNAGIFDLRYASGRPDARSLRARHSDGLRSRDHLETCTRSLVRRRNRAAFRRLVRRRLLPRTSLWQGRRRLPSQRARL